MNKLMKMAVLASLVYATSAFISVPAETDSLKPMVAGNSAFALDLYGQLKSKDGNLFFSPYSISTCLAMTYAGARGETEKQMAQVLHFGTDQNQVHSSFGELHRQLNEIQKKKSVELNVANGLWAEQSHSFLPAYVDITRQNYEANLKQVDFQTGADSVRIEINDWVSNRTKGKILNLISPGLLSPRSRLVLVNAIYFKGNWTRQFKTNLTASAPFFVTGAKQVQSRLMSKTDNFKYAEPEGLQLLELPYAGEDLSMVVLLPREQSGLKRLESLLDLKKLNDWIAAAQNQKVEVFLPRFKMEAQFNLSNTLSNMGMPEAFNPKADFSGMDGKQDLNISFVVHKAFVEVNEKGTEAAAATGIGMGRSTAFHERKPVPTFRADHPFIFLIRDNVSGSILFLGRLIDPTV